jgi:hypothetical protein
LNHEGTKGHEEKKEKAYSEVKRGRGKEKRAFNAKTQRDEGAKIISPCFNSFFVLNPL